MNFRTSMPILLILAGFASVLAILWKEEFKNYLTVDHSSELLIDSEMDLSFLSNTKPSYLHFFSEDCRNARINLSHISRIVSRYGEDASFFVINSGNLNAESLRKKYDLPQEVHIINDSDRRLTSSLDIKSLPYALISTAKRRLFFGGNYNNKNGLCGAGEIIWSSPAVALKFLINHQNPPLFPNYQLDFIGCET